jgi:hypothetical protein
MPWIVASGTDSPPDSPESPVRLSLAILAAFLSCCHSVIAAFLPGLPMCHLWSILIPPALVAIHTDALIMIMVSQDR